VKPSVKELIAINEQLRAALAAETERFVKAFSPAQPPASQPTFEPAGGYAGKETSPWKL